ncbi:MAG: tetratricopeptide repeat protein [Bacteroidetes bacterium]|nr:tetratricopeptide repeat protein [Bacteroidota bacterium]
MKNKKTIAISPTLHSIVHRYAGLLVFLFAFLLYVNTIPNDYSLDDQFAVKDNHLVAQGISAIPEILTTPYYMIDGKTGGEYRPLTKISFALEHEFFSINPHVSHFIQSIIYAGVCLMLFIFLRQIFPFNPVLLPFTVALLFAAHPIHTEVGASLKNREELFSLLFSLLFLMFFLRAWDKKRVVLWLFVFLLFMLALISKQSSLVLIFWTPLLLYYTHKDVKPRQLVFVGAALFLIVILYAFWVQQFILKTPLLESGRIYAFEENPLVEQDFLIKLGTAFNSLGFYIRKLIFPHPLGWYYGYNMVPMQMPWAVQPLFYFLIHLGLFAWAIKGILQRKLLALAILLYLFAIAPYANILVLAPGIVAERLAFFASIGFCLALALLLLRGSGMNYHKPEEKIKPLFPIMLLMVLLLYSVKTYSRNKDWENYLTLFSADIGYLENSYIAQHNYAFELYRAYKFGAETPPAGTLETVVKHYRKAIEIYPGNAFTNARLAEILSVDYHDPAAAIPYLQQSVALKPEKAEFHFDLATCYQQLKQFDSAMLHYKTAIQLDSSLTAPLLNLAVLFSDAGMQDSAIYYNFQALVRKPMSEVAQANMGFFYKKAGDFETARKYFKKALTINPKRQDVLDAIKEMDIAAEKPSQ